MIGQVFIAGVALVLGVYFQSSVNGLDCLSCHGAANITDCLTQTASCKDAEEQCYLDKVINPDLNAVFNAGCRANLICDFISGNNDKRSASKRQSTACAQCCNTAPDSSSNIPCNGYLCNQSPKPPGDTCAVCDRVSNVTSCTESEQCPSNEVCSIKVIASGNNLVYELGCEQKTICDVLLKTYKETHKQAGRSEHGDVEICAACCTERNCNKGNCFELIKNQTCSDPKVCGS